MILSERRGPVLHLSLNRPEVRNAFDEKTIAEITGAFKSVAKQKGLRAVVMRGAGQDFCAGADINWMKRAAKYSMGKNKKDAARLIAMCQAIDECPVPVITRVHGNCFGGALGIVAASDIAVAADNTTMAFSECRLGIIPAVVSTFVIPKIGVSHARRLFLTAESFGAGIAKSVGLVHEVAPESELDRVVDRMIHWILRAGPQAVMQAKVLIRAVEAMDRKRRIEHTVKTLAKIRATPEAKEGLGAFLEKRRAAWVPEPKA